jgi:transposase
VVSRDIYIYNNLKICVAGDNSKLVNMLGDIGIDAMRLPTCSPELNPIKLIFNTMVQKFAS